MDSNNSFDRACKLLKLHQRLRNKDIADILGLSEQQVKNKRNGSQKFIPSELNKLLSLLPDTHKGTMNTDEVQAPKITYNRQPRLKTTEWRPIPLVNMYAYASYSDQWDDPDFSDTMMHIPTDLAPDDKGNFLWFEIRGNSMERPEDPSINEGDSVLVKELQRKYWTSPIKLGEVWIIHTSDGLMCKEIIEHRLSDQTILCHSWNVEHEDFRISLNDVYQLFYYKRLMKKYL